MSSSASSSGYNSAAQSVEMETSPSFYQTASGQPNGHQYQNVYAIYSPQLHIYSQHNGSIPPQGASSTNDQFSPRDTTDWTQPQLPPSHDWMQFNGSGFNGQPPAYNQQSQYGQN